MTGSERYQLDTVCPYCARHYSTVGHYAKHMREWHPGTQATADAERMLAQAKQPPPPELSDFDIAVVRVREQQARALGQVPTAGRIARAMRVYREAVVRSLVRIERKGFGDLLDLPGLTPSNLGNNVDDTPATQAPEKEAPHVRTRTIAF